jgi:hypothetical protein
MDLSIESWNKIALSLSEERLTKYREHTLINTDKEILIFYTWNQELSMTLYPWVESVEIALRNAIHHTLSCDRSNPWWFDDSILIYKTYERKQISVAKETLSKQNKTLTPGKIVAELNFGFWTSLFHTDYEYKQVLWPRLLTQIFPDMKRHLRNRKAISHRLRDIRLLRNRIFHYEPIWHWSDLLNKQQELAEILSGLNRDLYEYVNYRSQFVNVYKSGLKNIKSAFMTYSDKNENRFKHNDFQ